MHDPTWDLLNRLFDHVGRPSGEGWPTADARCEPCGSGAVPISDEFRDYLIAVEKHLLDTKVTVGGPRHVLDMD